MKKNILIIVLTVFLINLNIDYGISESQLTPSVNITYEGQINKERIIGKGSIGIVGAGGVRFDNPMSAGIFGRFLFDKLKDLHYNNHQHFRRIFKGVQDNYYIYSYDWGVAHEFYRGKSNVTDETKGIYITNNLGLIIAYCLLERFAVNPELQTDFFTNIKSLPVNNSYLKSELIVPSGATLTVHEKDHVTFIERYVIVKNFEHELILLDAFYPKSLDTFLKDDIVSQLNHMMDYFFTY